MAIKKKTGGRDFKKGQSGNPKGRPKSGNSWKDIIDAAISRSHKVGKATKTVKAIIGDVLANKAVTGDLKAIEMIMDRQEGKPDTKLVHSDVDPADDVDLSKLTDKELAAYEKLMKKAAKK